MTIEHFVISEEGEQELKAKKGEKIQTKVSLQGDIAVLPFFPTEDTDGIAWLLLQDTGRFGEPGREFDKDLMGERMLAEEKGVIIGARNPESLTSIIDALCELRQQLIEQDVARKMARETAKDLDEEISETIEHGGPRTDPWNPEGPINF